MTSSQASSIISLLEQNKIIPHVISSANVLDLEGRLDIQYPTHTLVTGETLPRSVTKDVPTIKFGPFGGGEALSEEDKYTIIMSDPDLFMPHDRLSGEVRHWLQSGIFFDASGLGRYTTPPISSYVPCTPGAPGHKHRYIFILARESPGSTPKPEDFASSAKVHDPNVTNKVEEDLKDRVSFKSEEYILKKGMKIVGITYMNVGPDAESLVENVKLGATAIVDKLTGK